MPTTIRRDTHEALASIQLKLTPLAESVKAGYLARASCTPNDPPFIPALLQWSRTVRVLREHLIPEGWSKSDDSNYCVVRSPDKRIAIAVSSGCENTGNLVLMPTTKCPKGPSTVDAVVSNAAQYSLFGFEPKLNPLADDSDCATWLLLFYVARDELRSELSLPAAMGDDGRPNAWMERIILPAVPLDPVEPTQLPDFGPDLDVHVTRRPAGA